MEASRSSSTSNSIVEYWTFGCCFWLIAFYAQTFFATLLLCNHWDALEPPLSNWNIFKEIKIVCIAFPVLFLASSRTAHDQTVLIERIFYWLRGSFERAIGFFKFMAASECKYSSHFSSYVLCVEGFQSKQYKKHLIFCCVHDNKFSSLGLNISAGVFKT